MGLCAGCCCFLKNRAACCTVICASSLKLSSVTDQDKLCFELKKTQKTNKMNSAFCYSSKLMSREWSKPVLFLS